MFFFRARKSRYTTKIYIVASHDNHESQVRLKGVIKSTIMVMSQFI
jgi:hypothetical protein